VRSRAESALWLSYRADRARKCADEADKEATRLELEAAAALKQMEEAFNEHLREREAQ